ncbi:MAG: hypothetical protein GY898_01135 [Proteobacteria bacterium]|nr:hypothetical protein [Pseudomonadota bacterium]
MLPTDEADVDGDGSIACLDDCDDEDPDVGPNAPENTNALCHDEIDNDCDGEPDILEDDCVDFWDIVDTGGRGRNGGGCSCEAGAAEGGVTPWAALLLVFGFGRRRRRAKGTGPSGNAGDAVAAPALQRHGEPPAHHHEAEDRHRRAHRGAGPQAVHHLSLEHGSVVREVAFDQLQEAHGGAHAAQQRHQAQAQQQREPDGGGSIGPRRSGGARAPPQRTEEVEQDEGKREP